MMVFHISLNLHPQPPITVDLPTAKPNSASVYPLPTRLDPRDLKYLQMTGKHSVINSVLVVRPW